MSLFLAANPIYHVAIAYLLTICAPCVRENGVRRNVIFDELHEAEASIVLNIQETHRTIRTIRADRKRKESLLNKYAVDM
jgi:hypothetical protein